MRYGKKKQGNAIMIIRMYNHTNNEDFQIEVSETMIHKCHQVVNDVLETYLGNNPDHAMQYLDFFIGHDYPKGKW